MLKGTLAYLRKSGGVDVVDARHRGHELARHLPTRGAHEAHQRPRVLDEGADERDAPAHKSEAEFSVKEDSKGFSIMFMG